MATSQPPVTPAAASLMEDFVDIFTSPSEVFRRRMGSNGWVPLAIIVVLSAVLYFATKGLLQPVFDAEWARQLAKVSAKDPAAATAMEGSRGMVEKFGALFVIIGLPISMALTGVVLWLVGKIFGSAATVGDAIMVAIYAWVPRVLSFVASAVIMLMMDPAKVNSMFSATLSAGKIMDPDATSPVLFVLAGRVDVFIIWQTVLLAIGLSVVGKIPRTQAYIAAALVWFLGACPALLGALRQ